MTIAGTPKKLISFSLYGTEPLYQFGALKNLECQKQIYPEWSCRFYVSEEVDQGLIDRLRNGGAEVVLKKRSHFCDAMFWRFLPTDDPEIDVVIDRDTDSRLTWRERHAVDEWLESGKSFHIMRDHPSHTERIMGGMWGARKGAVAGMAELIEKWSSFGKYGDDQDFLGKCVYSQIRENVLVHSEFVKFRGESPQPFPSKREHWEFVGNPYDLEDRPFVPSPKKQLHLILSLAEMRMNPLHRSLSSILRRVG